MNGDLFQRCAQALFPNLGETWHKGFSREFMVNERTVRRMQKGVTPVPDSLRNEIYMALREGENPPFDLLAEIAQDMRHPKP